MTMNSVILNNDTTTVAARPDIRQLLYRKQCTAIIKHPLEQRDESLGFVFVVLSSVTIGGLVTKTTQTPECSISL